jgi:hypothetical protein
MPIRHGPPRATMSPPALMQKRSAATSAAAPATAQPLT